MNKRADFILIDRNPLADISNIRQPLGVMTSGIWLPKDKIEQLLEVKRQAASSILQEVMASHPPNEYQFLPILFGYFFI